MAYKNNSKQIVLKNTKKTGIGQRKSYTVPSLERVPDKEKDKKYR